MKKETVDLTKYGMLVAETTNEKRSLKSVSDLFEMVTSDDKDGKALYISALSMSLMAHQLKKIEGINESLVGMDKKEKLGLWRGIVEKLGTPIPEMDLLEHLNTIVEEEGELNPEVFAWCQKQKDREPGTTLTVSIPQTSVLANATLAMDLLEGMFGPILDNKARPKMGMRP